METTKLSIGKITVGIVIVILGLMVVLSTFGTVAAGERGVKTRLGKVVSVIEPGFYVKLPFIEHVQDIDVQTQKEQTEADAASSDLQTVKTVVAINYSIDSSKVDTLYQNIGLDYKTKVIDPSIQEVLKAVTARYTAEQLITQRPKVTEDIQTQLSSRLSPLNIMVSSVSIVNFDFSGSFNAAIEAKVTAEQNALAAKNKLEQVKFEAEQTVTKAKADAEAIKIQAEAITQQGGHDYVQLQAINKWNGALPTQFVPGSAIPFLDLK